MYTRIMEVDPWVIKSTTLDKTHKRLQESLTSLGNGYMGARGSFEERYSADSHLGTYIAGVGFPDKTRVGWWKNGYPKYFGPRQVLSPTACGRSPLSEGAKELPQP